MHQMHTAKQTPCAQNHQLQNGQDGDKVVMKILTNFLG